MNIINVLIIEESPSIRMEFNKIFDDHEQIHMAVIASTPSMAMKKAKSSNQINTIIIDIEDGRESSHDTLKKLLDHFGVPVIIFSKSINKKHRLFLEADKFGQIDIIEKPETDIKQFMSQNKDMFINKIRKNSKEAGSISNTISSSFSSNSRDKRVLKEGSFFSKNGDKFTNIVAIGSSTGGMQVIENIFKSLPEKTVPILVVQHMQDRFATSMVKRVNEVSKVTVKIADDGEVIKGNTVYIATGNRHMTIQRDGKDFIIAYNNKEKISHHKPSIDELFNSFADNVKNKTVAFILTGMGFDGARGIKAIKDSGGKTYAQDEKSCIVYGMPKEAIKIGGIYKSVTPDQIIEIISREY
jgi:two-component system chemotaxis response regulator CheB